MVSVATVLFVWLVSFPIGIYSATHQYSLGDYGLSIIGFIGMATPSFLLALVMLYFANVWFGTSIGGLMDPVYLDEPWSWGKAQSVLAHLWLPVVVIGASGTASQIGCPPPPVVSWCRSPPGAAAALSGATTRPS